MHARKPVWLWIDPSRACNLACAFCYSKRSHTEEHLSLHDFRSFLDTLLSSTAIVIQKMHLNWRGDPLMNPRLPELLAELEARRPYFPYELHTNGTPMTRELAAKLVAGMRSGELYVSIDGGTEAGHDSNRGKGTFRLALQAVWMLLEARGPRNVPRIGVFQIDMGDPEAAYDGEFVEVVCRVDDWVRIDPVNPQNGQRVKVRPRSRDAHLASDPPSSGGPRLQPQDRWWTLQLPADLSIPHGPCFWAGNALFIAPNGDVSVCLLSHTSDGVLGNLHRDPLESILGAADRFRETIATVGRGSVPHCSGCRMAEGLPKVTLFDVPKDRS